MTINFVMPWYKYFYKFPHILYQEIQDSYTIIFI